ncbi:MAG: VWA domain-containing protein [Spirochaetaceae bacterium]|nr:VWA domain-containing protein [Spirochaetaceae bacterium]
MKAESPAVFFLLAALVPLVLAAFAGYRRGKAARGLFEGAEDGAGSSTLFFVRSLLDALFFCLFLVFSVFALAGILWGTAPEAEDKSGLDVVVVLDVSRSMLAQDEEPSRLAAARDTARGLLQSLPRARFAVVAFKGSAIIAIPMTEDRQILETFFQNVSPAAVNAPGTNVEAGLELALEAFPRGTASHRAIVLLSDGEALSDFSLRSAEKAGAEGIPVFPVGLGSDEGSVIRLPDGSLITGKDGKPVITRRNAPLLEKAASLSQGAYFSSREPGLTGRLTEKLRDFGDAREKMGFRLAPKKSYRSFLFAGFLALCAAVCVRSLKWKKS